MASQSKQNRTSIPASSSIDLDDFERRLNGVRAKHCKQDPAQDQGSLLGMAWRLSTEIVVAVLVGTGLGYGLDIVLDTKPWSMLIGLGFGFATGIRNVLRVSDKMAAHEMSKNEMNRDRTGSPAVKTERDDRDKI